MAHCKLGSGIQNIHHVSSTFLIDYGSAPSRQGHQIAHLVAALFRWNGANPAAKFTRLRSRTLGGPLRGLGRDAGDSPIIGKPVITSNQTMPLFELQRSAFRSLGKHIPESGEEAQGRRPSLPGDQTPRNRYHLLKTHRLTNLTYRTYLES